MRPQLLKEVLDRVIETREENAGEIQTPPGIRLRDPSVGVVKGDERGEG